MAKLVAQQFVAATRSLNSAVAVDNKDSVALPASKKTLSTAMMAIDTALKLVQDCQKEEGTSDDNTLEAQQRRHFGQPSTTANAVAGQEQQR